MRTSHAEIGAYLLGLWGLPAQVTEAVAFHHQPGICGHQGLSPLAAVHVANVLVQESGEPEPNSQVAELDCSFLEQAGILHRVERWREKFSCHATTAFK